jgi:hypothetical protein
MMCTGLKKCMPTTRGGCGVTAAMRVTESEDVFVAEQHVRSEAPAEVAKIDCFSSSFSGTASIANCTPWIASSRFVVPESLAIAASRTAGSTFPFSTPLSRFARAAPSPRSTIPAATSCSRVSIPAVAST